MLASRRGMMRLPTLHRRHLVLRRLLSSYRWLARRSCRQSGSGIKNRRCRHRRSGLSSRLCRGRDLSRSCVCTIHSRLTRSTHGARIAIGIRRLLQQLVLFRQKRTSLRNSLTACFRFHRQSHHCKHSTNNYTSRIHQTEKQSMMPVGDEADPIHVAERDGVTTADVV